MIRGTIVMIFIPLPEKAFPLFRAIMTPAMVCLVLRKFNCVLFIVERVLYLLFLDDTILEDTIYVGDSRTVPKKVFFTLSVFKKLCSYA
jgi:hypothetical protein